MAETYVAKGNLHAVGDVWPCAGRAGVRVTGDLENKRLCLSNKILRSANAK